MSAPAEALRTRAVSTRARGPRHTKLSPDGAARLAGCCYTGSSANEWVGSNRGGALDRETRSIVRVSQDAELLRVDEVDRHGRAALAAAQDVQREQALGAAHARERVLDLERQPKLIELVKPGARGGARAARRRALSAGWGTRAARGGGPSFARCRARARARRDARTHWATQGAASTALRRLATSSSRDESTPVSAVSSAAISSGVNAPSASAAADEPARRATAPATTSRMCAASAGPSSAALSALMATGAIEPRAGRNGSVALAATTARRAGCLRGVLHAAAHEITRAMRSSILHKL